MKIIIRAVPFALAIGLVGFVSAAGGTRTDATARIATDFVASKRAASLDFGCDKCIDWSGETPTHDFTAIPCTSDGTCFHCIDQDCTPEGAYSGTCSAHHGECAMQGPSPDDLEAAVAVDDFQLLRHLVSTYPSALSVNADRGVVQVFNCNGLVSAQYTLSRQTMGLMTQ
jgi:Zn-dependent alcohol dehydrogenase